MIKTTLTQTGFTFGAMEVSRYCCDDKKGWVVVGLITPKSKLQVYVTKSGKIRVFNETTRKELK